MPRKYKVAVYGATGYSGTLVCEYAARHHTWAPSEWCIAGRNHSRLLALREHLATINSSLALVAVEAFPSDALDTLARSCDVLLNCAGPYAVTGGDVVAACVAAGTHYVDITGEPQFVKAIIAKYHDAAVARNVVILPCAGFDCVPTDVGVWYALSLNKDPHDAKVRRVRTFVSPSRGLSTGTCLTFLHSVSQAPPPPASSPSSRSVKKQDKKPRPHYSKDAGGKWVVPLPSADALIVRRTNGDAISYEHYLVCNTFWGFVGTIFATAVLFLIILRSQRLTEWLKGKMGSRGDGPTPASLRTESSNMLVSVNEEVCAEVTMSHVYTVTACSAVVVADLVASSSSSAKNIIRYGVVTPVQALGGERLMEALAATSDYSFN